MWPCQHLHFVYKLGITKRWYIGKTFQAWLRLWASTWKYSSCRIILPVTPIYRTAVCGTRRPAAAPKHYWRSGLEVPGFLGAVREMGAVSLGACVPSDWRGTPGFRGGDYLGEKGVCPGPPRGPQNKEDALLPLHPPSSLWEDPERLSGPSLGPSYEEQPIPTQAPRLGAVGMKRLDPLPSAPALGLTGLAWPRTDGRTSAVPAGSAAIAGLFLGSYPQSHYWGHGKGVLPEAKFSG